MNQPMNVSIDQPEVISIVCVTGYVKHHLYQLVSDIFEDVQKDISSFDLDYYGFGLHFYPADNYGNECTMVTNFSVPPTDDISYLWDAFSEAQDESTGYHSVGSVEISKEPLYFTHGGQKYQILMVMDGYSYDSTSPEDDRYEN